MAHPIEVFPNSMAQVLTIHGIISHDLHDPMICVLELLKIFLGTSQQINGRSPGS